MKIIFHNNMINKYKNNLFKILNKVNIQIIINNMIINYNLNNKFII